MRIRCVSQCYTKNSSGVGIDVVYSVMYKTGKFSMRKFSVCDASHNATKKIVAAWVSMLHAVMRNTE